MHGTEACGLQHTSSPRAKALERRANAAAALMHEPAGQATRAVAQGQIGGRLGDGNGVPVVSANAQVDFARGPAGPVAAVNEVLSRLLPSQSRAVASKKLWASVDSAPTCISSSGMEHRVTRNSTRSGCKPTYDGVCAGTGEHRVFALDGRTHSFYGCSLNAVHTAVHECKQS